MVAQSTVILAITFLQLMLLGVSTPNPLYLDGPPTFIRQPPSDELVFLSEDGKPFLLECEATGSPTYVWKKNGMVFHWSVYGDRISSEGGSSRHSFNKTGTLLFHRPETHDEGYYQCFATNDFGTAMSNAVHVRKGDLGHFEPSPGCKRIDAFIGSSVGLTCRAPDGYPRPSIHWMVKEVNAGNRFLPLNPSRATVDPDGTLWFPHLGTEDVVEGRMYVCVAASESLSVFRVGNDVCLNARSPNAGASGIREVALSTLYKSHTPFYAFVGSSAKLYCIFGGSSAEIRWVYPNSLRMGEVRYDDFGRTLVIDNVTESHEGQYRCEASNGAGPSLSHAFGVKIQAKPVLISPPEPIVAGQGDRVLFHCQAYGKPQPAIQWFYNAQPLAESRTVLNIVRFSNGSLLLPNVTRAFTGNYACNASNTLGYAFRDVYLVVKDMAPKFLRTPQSVTVVEGSRVELECRVAGSPSPTIRWMKGGARGNVSLTGGRYGLHSTGDLIIPEVKFTDAGRYFCVAENRIGKLEPSELQVAILMVKGRTRVTVPPRNQRLTAGEAANFHCSASGDMSEEIRIQWYHNGRKVDPELSSRYILLSHGTSLRIVNVGELDTGTLTCEARTSLDTAVASAHLLVTDVPNKPELLRVVCDGLKAKISWRPTGDRGASIMYYSVQARARSRSELGSSFRMDNASLTDWNEDFDAPWFEVDRAPVTDVEREIPLKPWASYRFRIIAVNAVGESEPSEVSSGVCLTAEAVPLVNPDLSIVTPRGPRNLTIRWQRVMPIDHGGPDFAYSLLLRPLDPLLLPIDAQAAIQWKEVQLPWRTSEYSFPRGGEIFEVKIRSKNRLGISRASAPTLVVHRAPYRIGHDIIPPLRIDESAGPDSVRIHWLRRIDSVYGPARIGVQSDFSHFKVLICRNDMCYNSNEYRLSLLSGRTPACTDCFCVPPEWIRKEVVVPEEARSATVHNVWRGESLCASVTSVLGNIHGDRPVSVSVPVAYTPPGAVSLMRATPIGPTSVKIDWWPPKRVFPECSHEYATLLLEDPDVSYYDISYAEVDGTRVGSLVSGARVEVLQMTGEKDLNLLGRMRSDSRLTKGLCGSLKRSVGERRRNFSVVLTELKPGQKYRFLVRAGNAHGLGPAYYVEQTPMPRERSAPAITHAATSLGKFWNNVDVKYLFANDNSSTGVRISLLEVAEHLKWTPFYIEHRPRGFTLFERTSLYPYLEKQVDLLGFDSSVESISLRFSFVFGGLVVSSPVFDVDAPSGFDRWDISFSEWYIGMILAVGVLLACFFCVCACREDRKHHYFVRWEEEMATRKLPVTMISPVAGEMYDNHGMDLKPENGSSIASGSYDDSASFVGEYRTDKDITSRKKAAASGKAFLEPMAAEGRHFVPPAPGNIPDEPVVADETHLVPPPIPPKPKHLTLRQQPQPLDVQAITEKHKNMVQAYMATKGRPEPQEALGHGHRVKPTMEAVQHRQSSVTFTVDVTNPHQHSQGATTLRVAPLAPCPSPSSQVQRSKSFQKAVQREAELFPVNSGVGVPAKTTARAKILSRSPVPQPREKTKRERLVPSKFQDREETGPRSLQPARVAVSCDELSDLSDPEVIGDVKIMNRRHSTGRRSMRGSSKAEIVYISAV